MMKMTCKPTLCTSPSFSSEPAISMSYRGRGGGLVRAYFGKAKFGEGKIWYKILNTTEKNGTKIFQMMGDVGIELGSSTL